MSTGHVIEVIRLVVEAAAFGWIVLKGMRSFATLEANTKMMMDNHLPHLFDDIQRLNKRIDDLVATLVDRGK